jgi:TPR repeat protein
VSLPAILLLSALAAAPAPAKVAVLDVEVAPGVEGADAAALTEVFAGSLQDSQAWKLSTLRDVAAVMGLERQRQILGCTGPACVTETGSALGAEAVVAGSVGRVGGALEVSGRILDARTAAVLARASAPVGEAGLAAALRQVGSELRDAWRVAHGLAPRSRPGAAGPTCADPEACRARCGGGDGAACAQLGTLLREATPPDPGRAAGAFEQACDLGEKPACLQAAEAYVAAGLPSSAVPLYDRACRADDLSAPRACARGGALLLEGRGVARNAEAGAALLRRACDAGAREGCDLLAAALVRDEAEARDDAEATQLLEDACARGVAGTCAALVTRLRTRNPARSAELARAACEGGDGPTCLAGAEGYLSQGSPGTAASLLRAACERSGAADVCARAAQVVLDGAQGGREIAEGAALAGRACDAGRADACAEAARAELALPAPDAERVRALLARGCPPAKEGPRRDQARLACNEGAAALSLGRIGPEDGAAALRIVEPMCRAGDAAACRSAAVIHRTGDSVARDARKAREFAEAACDAGSGADCYGVGLAYERGQEVEPSPSRAARLYQAGCRLRSGASCAALGALYRTGLGVAADRDRAAELLRQACALGAQQACAAAE